MSVTKLRLNSNNQNLLHAKGGKVISKVMEKQLQICKHYFVAFKKDFKVNPKNGRKTD